MIVNEECGTGYGGNGGFMLVLVVLILVFGMGFRNGGWGGNSGEAAAGFGLGGLTAAADMMTFNRYSNYMDPQLARLECEQAVDTGKIQRQQAVDTGTIIHTLDVQTCDIEKAVGRSIDNQNRLALDAERMFYNNIIDGKNEKIAEQRLVIAEQQSRALQQDTVNTMNNQFCLLNNRLTRFEDHVPLRPPYYSLGGVAAVNACPPYPAAAGYSGCCA